jgi:hypothetical protein
VSKKAALLSLLVVVDGLASPDATAQAPSGDVCLITPVDGQKLRRAGKLLDARAKFSTCARPSCPREIVERCTRWTEETQTAIPSVVLVARDPQGRDLSDVAVSIDGAAAAPIATGGVELDPGEHVFLFQRGGSPNVEERIILREGQKDRQVVATLVVPGSTPARAQEATSSRAPAAAPAAAPEATREAAPEATPEAPRPVPTLTWVLGGVGLAALGSFGTFAALGVSERSSDHCDTGCTPSEKSDVDTKLLIADVSLGVGVVAIVAATWLYLARPSVTPSTASFVDVRPVRSGAVALFGARF